MWPVLCRVYDRQQGFSDDDFAACGGHAASHTQCRVNMKRKQLGGKWMRA